MLNILIVDDSSLIRKMLTRMLHDMNHNVVATAKTGLEGIKLYEEFKPDLVTMDINMPKMSGLDALKNIKKNHPDANVLMLTTVGDDQSVIEAIKMGAKGYLLKPPDFDKIRETINHYLEVKTTSNKKTDEIQSLDDYIKDNLTDLYSNEYMHHTIQYLFDINDRDENVSIGSFIININDLEKMSKNDADGVLRKVANELKIIFRASDFLVRLEYDKFAVFVTGSSTNEMDLISNKLKNNLENIQNEFETKSIEYKISIGISIREQKEELDLFLKRTQKIAIKAYQNEDSRICMLNE